MVDVSVETVVKINAESEQSKVDTLLVRRGRVLCPGLMMSSSADVNVTLRMYAIAFGHLTDVILDKTFPRERLHFVFTCTP
jgi:hypothetical protein